MFSRGVAAGLLLVLLHLGGAALAAPETADQDAPEPDPQESQEVEETSGEWESPLVFYDLSAPCSGDCRAMVAFGRYVETSMSDIFFDPVGPWDWEFGDIYFASLTFGRKAADWGKYVSFEPEIGIGKRFGDATEFEFWGAIYARWNPFFWDHIIDTSIAASTGLNYATGNSSVEEERAGGDSSRLQHYFSPEITFALPDDKRFSFVVRLHHRSSAGIFDGGGALQYLMGGLRVHF